MMQNLLHKAKYHTLTVSAGICLALMTSAAAQAATFTYVGTIDTVSQSSAATYPALGWSGATITVEIDDSDPSKNIFLPSGAAEPFMAVTVDAPGYFSGYLPPGSFDAVPQDGLTVTGDGFFYGSAYGPSNTVQTGGDTFFAQALHYFSLDYGTSVIAPTTIGELVAAMSAPGASGVFSWEGDPHAGAFDHIRVTFDASVATVPVPATGILLLGALGAIGVARRRHKGV